MTIAQPSPPRRFHWRTLPVGVLAAFGVIMLAFVTFDVVYMSCTAWTGKPMYTPGPRPGFTLEGIKIAVVGALCGVALLFASVQLWRGRWRLTLLVIAVLIAFCQLLYALGVMRH